MSVPWPIVTKIYEELKTFLRGKRLAYQYRSEELIGPDDIQAACLQILCKGSPVQRVTGTKIVFWNKRRAQIRASELKDITVEFGEDVKLLVEPKVIKTEPEGNIIRFTVKQIEAGKVRIEFDHLKKNNGAQVAILHTGDGTMTPNVQGQVLTVEGVQDLGRAGVRMPSSTLEKWIFVAISGVIAIIVLPPLITILSGGSKTYEWGGEFNVLYLGPVVIILLLVKWRLKKRRQTDRYPERLGPI